MKLFQHRKKQTRADPMRVVITDSGESLIPGYTPLSRNADVLRCVHRIADTVSNMTIMLMENGTNGDIRVKNGMSRALDIHPSKIMNRKNYIHKIVKDMYLYGNSVVLPQVDGEGNITDHRILNGSGLTFEKDGDLYKICYNGSTFQPDEVLHFAMNPDDNRPFKGAGIAPILKDVLQGLLQSKTTKNSFLSNKWKPPMIISISSDAEELQDPEMRRKILDSYTKTTEAGEPWLIPAGEIDVNVVKPLTLNDLAVKDGIEIDLKTLAGGIGVPLYMLGVGAFNKDEYNNFVETTVFSITQILEQEITRKELMNPKQYIKFNPKSLLQYSLTDKMAFVQGMVECGMLNRNEGRAEFDYSPVDEEGMNDYNVLENYIPISKIGDQNKLKGGKADE